MPKGPFLPENFSATKFSTAADKAEFGNHFLRFIDAEWAQTLFTKDFYHRLSMCFGHIAHYVERENMRSGNTTAARACCLDAQPLCIIPCGGR